MLQNFDRVAESYDNIESDHLKILYYDLEKGYEGTYKSYGNYRLCTMLTGKKKVAINGEKAFTYGASEYILLPPESSVEMTISSHTKAVVYEIDDQIINKISNRMEQNFSTETKIIKHNYSNELLKSVKNLNQNMYQQNKESRFFMDLHAQELVYRLMDDNNNQNLEQNIITHYDPGEVAKDIISKEGNEHLSIGEISEMLRLSQANLNYYFKKKFGISPKKYQNHIKVMRAKNMLKNFSVTEVAMKLGFDNISHFIRLFKAEYGLTPKQYSK